MQTAIFLEELVASGRCRRGWWLPPRCRSTARANTSAPGRPMSVRPAPRSSCWRASGSPAAPLRRRAAPGRYAGDQGADPDFDLRHHQARPRGAVPGHRGRLRHPGGGAALLQRLRPRPGALQPLHRRGRDLRLAAAERPRPRSSSRTATSRATSSTSATSCAGSCSRSSPTSGGASDQPRHRSPQTVSQIAGALSAGLESTSTRSSTASTAPATSATARPTRGGAGAARFRGPDVARGWHAGAAGMAGEPGRRRSRRRRGPRVGRSRPRPLTSREPSCTWTTRQWPT